MSARSRRSGPSACRRGKATQHHLRCDRGPLTGASGEQCRRGGTPHGSSAEEVSALTDVALSGLQDSHLIVWHVPPANPMPQQLGLTRGGAGTPQKEEGEPTPGASLSHFRWRKPAGFGHEAQNHTAQGGLSGTEPEASDTAGAQVSVGGPVLTPGLQPPCSRCGLWATGRPGTPPSLWSRCSRVPRAGPPVARAVLLGIRWNAQAQASPQTH